MMRAWALLWQRKAQWTASFNAQTLSAEQFYPADGEGSLHSCQRGPSWHRCELNLEAAVRKYIAFSAQGAPYGRRGMAAPLARPPGHILCCRA